MATTHRRVAVALELESMYSHHNDVFAGVQHYAAEHPQWEYVIDEHPFHKQVKGMPSFHDYDGVIARATPELARRLKRRGVPLVNTWFQQARPGLPGVYTDYAQIGQDATEHLLERGFRHFGVIDTPGSKGFQLISNCFIEQVEQEGYRCLTYKCIMGKYSDSDYWASLIKGLNDWLDQLPRPIALLFMAPLMARVAANVCHSRNWHVPRDVAILCALEARVITENQHPQISVLDLSLERQGYEAAALLDRLMDGEPPPTKPILIPPKCVIARESTDYFAIDDEVVAEALQYIAAHLHQRLTVDQIAEEIAVSPRLLQIRFSRALGRSISEEIRRLRLEKAKRMLTEPDRQLKEIARESGFGTHNMMSKIFQRELGATPSAYRKKVLGEREK